eukprot:2140578-Ditylum_brightwellii.AAC.1
MPTRVVAKKLENEEILEVYDNRILTSWNFQMDKEGFNECKPKETKEISAAHKSHSKRNGSAKPNVKLAKRLTMTGDEILHDVIPMDKDITIASTMGIATTPQKS